MTDLAGTIGELFEQGSSEPREAARDRDERTAARTELERWTR
jgi:hypothetical protein